MSAGVTALRSIEIGSADLAAAVDFYTRIWGLRVTERSAESVYFRASGAFNHILIIRQAPRPSVVRLVFDAAGRAEVDAIHGALAEARMGLVEEPGALDQPGGGYGFGFTDPEGRNLAVVCEVADHPDTADHADQPMRLAHVNLNCRDATAICRFLETYLGFRISDESRRAYFLRCNRWHNSLVITHAGKQTLNHVAFEMPDLDSLMRGVGRMRDSGYPIEWGVGRHGPGNNIFAYFLGPEEFPIEYTTDTLVVGDDHVARGPDHWVWPPGRTDQWGASPPISNRFERVQDLFPFVEKAYRIRS